MNSALDLSDVARMPRIGDNAIEVFSPQCPSCGGTERTVDSNPRSHQSAISGRFQFVACGGCGLIYQCPRPIGTALDDCYAVLPASRKATPPGPAPRKGLSGWLQKNWRRMNGQDAALPYIGKGPVLDAGCNRGELLLQLRSLGFEAEGLEFNGPAVEECRKLGFNVCLGDVTNAELPPTRYRTIILQHTLEHLTEPVSDLRKLAKSLVDSESAIVIVVPHVGSPVRRWFGDSWHGWDPPFHICQYTPKTLASLAERAGLRMHRYRLIFAPDDYTRSLALATCKPGRRLLLRLLLIPPMKLMQLFGYGGILVAELRPAPVRGD